jgi:hypothetical protein
MNQPYLLWEGEYRLPEKGIDFHASPSFTFSVNKFYAKYVPQFNFKVFDAKGLWFYRTCLAKNKK